MKVVRLGLYVESEYSDKSAKIKTDVHFDDTLARQYIESADDPYIRQAHLMLWKQDPAGFIRESSERIMNGLLGNDTLLEIAIEATRQKPAALLNAHGDQRKEWTYVAGRKRPPIKDWIRKQERDHGLLVIACCNPEGSKIEKSDSVVVHCNRDYLPPCTKKEIDPRTGFGEIEVYVPGPGYITSYEYEYALSQLR